MFVGREKEISILRGLLRKPSASLIVLKGRRRIGKSRLLEEYAKSFEKTYIFSGLAPTETTTEKLQRQEFVRQFVRLFKEEPELQGDWGDLFWELSKKASKGRTLIVLDEISWMGSLDDHFLSKLKNAWDLYFKKNDQLVLALCGSVSSWIEKNILSSTGFLGRESLCMTLKELPLSDCVKFWQQEAQRTSAYEKLKLLAVTGGVPRYLEMLDPRLSAETNIRHLCFSPHGILLNEFEKIFSDLFSQRSGLYRNIVNFLSKGAATQQQIIKGVGLSKNGNFSEYVDDLVQSGFVDRDYTWKIASGKTSKLSQYRLKDNYSRFYLKYISPYRQQIASGAMQEVNLWDLPGWRGIMGLQFENLVLSNKALIYDALGILAQDVVCSNPFFQRKTREQQGVQIDYMIQAKHQTLYVCEIKFSQKEVGTDVIHDMQQKLDRLKLPKGFSVRTVLIYVNGVSEQLEDQHYFSYLIDFIDFLT